MVSLIKLRETYLTELATMYILLDTKHTKNINKWIYTHIDPEKRDKKYVLIYNTKKRKYTLKIYYKNKLILGFLDYSLEYTEEELGEQ